MINTCVRCGTTFDAKTKNAYYCRNCRWEKRRKQAAQAAINRHFQQQPPEDGYNEKKAQAHETYKSARKLAALVEKRENAERLLKIEICPNFSRESMSCVTCPAGAWKFKACGRKQ